MFLSAYTCAVSICSRFFVLFILSQVFDAVEALGAVLFIDEVDALAGSRGSSSGGGSGHGGGDPGGGGGSSSDMHEATRRLLSVILQRVDGLEGPSKATLVCATNRRQDLDPALLSRFDLTLNFGLPDAKVNTMIHSRLVLLLFCNIPCLCQLLPIRASLYMRVTQTLFMNRLGGITCIFRLNPLRHVSCLPSSLIDKFHLFKRAGQASGGAALRETIEGS